MPTERRRAAINIPYESRATDFYYRSDDNLRHPLACGAHLHYHIEFFYLLEGHSRIHIDAATHDVHPGEIAVVFPNQIHRYERIEPERYLLYIVNPDLMPELESVFTRRVPTCAVVRNADQNASILPLLHLLAELSRQSEQYQALVMKGALLALFGQILPQMSLTEPSGQDGRAIRAIVDYCARNYTSPHLSLEALESELHLSRFYISHLFNNKLNIRFNDYINSLRISGACRLLQRTDLSMTEIGSLSGFNTVRTFNRSFVKQMGLTPSDYRRTMERHHAASS